MLYYWFPVTGDKGWYDITQNIQKLMIKIVVGHIETKSLQGEIYQMMISPEILYNEAIGFDLKFIGTNGLE